MLVFVAALAAGPQPQRAKTRVADGFDRPVGIPDGEGYYIARGFRSYHPGEDWNGLGGGNSDKGDPVFSIGNGLVTFARDARMGWGNVVIVRHAFVEDGKLEFVDSMYAHLDRITVAHGQQVKRGQQIGTIGTNRGMYVAHLHYEIRKNLFIGINRSAFPRDLENYHIPERFISKRRKLPGGGRSVDVPINTYQTDRPGFVFPGMERKAGTAPGGGAKPDGKFRVKRFDDIGY